MWTVQQPDVACVFTLQVRELTVTADAWQHEDVLAALQLVHPAAYLTRLKEICAGLQVQPLLATACCCPAAVNTHPSRAFFKQLKQALWQMRAVTIVF